LISSKSFKIRFFMVSCFHKTHNLEGYLFIMVLKNYVGEKGSVGGVRQRLSSLLHSHSSLKENASYFLQGLVRSQIHAIRGEKTLEHFAYR